MKTANNKIPVSSVFNDSEGLYGTIVSRCLVHRPHYFARGECVSGHVARASSPPKCLDRDCVGRRRTETMYGKSVREKKGKIVYGQRVLQIVTSLCVVSLVFRGYKSQILIPSKKPHFRYGKKNISLRERRKWSLGLGQHLKGALPNVRIRTSHTSREIKTATIRELTFLKNSKSREQFLLRLTLFYPI